MSLHSEVSDGSCVCGRRDSGSILEEAASLVNGPRQASYGHPSKDLVCTAGMWSAFLTRRFGIELELTGEDVGCLMSLLKLSRLAGAPGHRDSLVDAAGYLATVEMIQNVAGTAGAI